jgi:hypothetical protein
LPIASVAFFGLPLLDLIIGRSLPAQNGQIFLRREDQRKFYLGNYNLDLTRPLGDWLDVLGELHNFEAVQISLGEGDDKIILSREQENPPAWKVTNITSKQNLRLDAPLPKLPALLGKLEAIDMQPVSQLKPDSTERHQIIFTGKNGLDLFVTLAPVGRLVTAKVQEPLVLYPATEQHPAQTQLITKDVVTGQWDERKFSGAATRADQEALLGRIRKLQEAVKLARETANSAEVDKQRVGSPILDYVFGGILK